MVPATHALPGAGVRQVGVPPPVPTQMPLTRTVVVGSHCTAATHLPPTMTTLPPSTSHGVCASTVSARTHLRVPSGCCFCTVPGPQLAELQLASEVASETTAHTATEKDNNLRFIHSSYRFRVALRTGPGLRRDRRARQPCPTPWTWGRRGSG